MKYITVDRDFIILYGISNAVKVSCVIQYLFVYQLLVILLIFILNQTWNYFGWNLKYCSFLCIFFVCYLCCKFAFHLRICAKSSWLKFENVWDFIFNLIEWLYPYQQYMYFSHITVVFHMKKNYIFIIRNVFCLPT